jgi:coenzyme F420-reducing hydrogenase gamma subunit
MSKKRLATVWLDGCSGCHMSFLDMDERLIAIFQMADLVYSPLVDAKIFPVNVDITLVEGAVSSEEDFTRPVAGYGRRSGQEQSNWRSRSKSSPGAGRNQVA